MSASTQRLNYSQVPPRASSSRAIRNEITPTNGSSFNANSQIIIDLPANLNNTFCDFQSSYIKATVSNSDGSAANFCGGGFPSMIKQIVLELGGQTLFSCDSWNVLYEMMLSLDSSAQFRDNAGKRLFGAGGNFDGQEIAAGGSVKVCFPLVLTPLMANRYFPLIGRDRLRIRLILDTGVRGLVSANDLTDAQITVSDVALVTYNLELGSDVMAMVAANSGGAFKIAMPSYQSQQTTMATGDTTKNIVLGFSMSSLNRILVAQQKATITGAMTLGARNRNHITRFFVTIGGVKYPMRDVQDLGSATAVGGEGCEPFAEALISQRALCAWSHDSSIEVDGTFALENGGGTNSATTGSFLIDLDLESQRVAGGEGSLGLVAGVNTIGQVVSITLEYSGDHADAQVVNVYGEHTILCSLDLNTLTWSIAV